MADTILGGTFDFLLRIGFLNILVPFILFYAIVFGMLERTQVFSRDKKGSDQTRNLHSLIAFAIAITATATSNAVGITQNYLPILAVVSVVLLGVMLLLGMAFGDKFDAMLDDKKYKGIVWTFAGILIFCALFVMVYYSGLLVTPCSGDLTPVNSLSINEGECTAFIDASGLPNSFYLMGMNLFQIFGGELLGIIILIVIGVIVIRMVTKQ